MIKCRRKLGTPEKFEPVKQDKRIEFDGTYYSAILENDSGPYLYYWGLTLLGAQKAIETAPSNVYEGPDVPFSVFYPGRA